MSILSRFKNLSLARFLEEVEISSYFWIVKRLSGNDTGLTGGHQSGLYLPRVFFQAVLPEICTTKTYNPDAWIEECYFPAQDDSVKKLRAIYYNSKYFPEKGLKKKYDEFRLTRWGGSSSPVQDIENTGSICIFAVGRDDDKIKSVAWVASSVEEEDLIENWLGCEVEPGRFMMRSYVPQPETELILPEKWFNRFPTGKEIFSFVLRAFPRNKWTGSIDALLLKRREFEFEVFMKIENANVLPRIGNGFKTVEEFIKYAHSVSNRRKSRTGASLELNLEAIFIDEKLAFETQVITENRKKPDFLFPSGKAYHNHEFPSTKLHMMAAKTCCKDRWRQVLNEANRITPKHLFILQQGVSGNQLQEMKDNNIALVVPASQIGSFPKEWRNSLLTLDSFVKRIRTEQLNFQRLDQWIN